MTRNIKVQFIFEMLPIKVGIIEKQLKGEIKFNEPAKDWITEINSF